MEWLRGVDLNHRPLGYEPSPDRGARNDRRSAPTARIFAPGPGAIGLADADDHGRGGFVQRAMACNAQRRPWQWWHSVQRKICKLQTLLMVQQSESLSLRHN
jgi:hypothetical protein